MICKNYESRLILIQHIQFYLCDLTEISRKRYKIYLFNFDRSKETLTRTVVKTGFKHPKTDIIGFYPVKSGQNCHIN